MQRRKDQSNLALLAFIVFIDMTGIGIIIPVLPDLIAEISGKSLQGAALVGSGLLLAYGLMAFFCAPVIGGLSDRFGRRPVVLVTLTAIGIDYFAMAFAPTLILLLAGRLIAGAMGATWTAAYACIADIFPPDERAARFGLLGGAGAAGYVLGPAMGGILGEYELRLPFLVAGTLALIGAFVAWLQFAETLPIAQRRRFAWSRANPLGTLLQMRKNPTVSGMITTLFFLNLAHQATMATWAFQLIERFSWSPLKIGSITAIYGILLVAVQGKLTGVINARIGPVRTATLGFIFVIPAFAVLALANSSAMILTGLVLGAFGGMSFPTIQGLMTARVDQDSQGELQGALASTLSLAAIFGPLIMLNLFAKFSDKEGFYLPGAPFILSMLLAILSCIIFLLLNRRSKPSQNAR